MMPKSVKRFSEDIMLYPFDLEPDGFGTKETISPPSGKNVKSGLPPIR
ncbi:hypothetical protein X755_12960 [Mesorhizobium sp. LNJC405B00]|nr:hypothetical protein X756_10765 [Mesorhizobium sp. LSHC412B00]ESX99119.1 hypothetical protein X755_12960 [Mesorhizobium sp. LNJC405B00]ESZ04118.1 hypothetical protein X736_23315 [Mesorhizobium sp. L2C089B000]